jgi:hypothetical protein
MCTRMTKRKRHSWLIKGYSSSQSCLLASATLWRHLRDSWRQFCEVSLTIHVSCTYMMWSLFGHTFEEHLLNLRKVFQRFWEACLKLNPEKCQLLQKEVQYLGHIVSPEGISTNPEKLKAVREWPTMKNKHEIRSFLGLCTCYRRFIPGLLILQNHWPNSPSRSKPSSGLQRWKPLSKRSREPCVMYLFLLTLSQERGSSWTQAPVTLGLEECSPKYRMDRSEL